MEKRCNQCKRPFSGRKSCRTHGEETGHEWQPMIACVACGEAFKKQKLYKAHLPMNPICAAARFRTQPSTSLPRPNPVTLPGGEATLAPERPNTSKDIGDFHSGTVIIRGGNTPLVPENYGTSRSLLHEQQHAAERHIDAGTRISVIEVPTDQSCENPRTGTNAETAYEFPTETANETSAFDYSLATANGVTADQPPLYRIDSSNLKPRMASSHPAPGTSDKTVSLRWHCRSCFSEPCDEPVATVCGHIFCRNCIVEEIATGMGCPACKQIFLVRLDV